MSGASATLKAALAHNGLTLPALVALGEHAAMRLPLVGRKVWAEALEQSRTKKRGGARSGAGRKADDGATDLVQIAVRVTQPQRVKLAKLGGSVWIRRAIDDAAEV